MAMKNRRFHYNSALSEACFTDNAPVAQLDRVPGYELGGHTFESCRVHQT